MNNIYLPRFARIDAIVDEAPDTRTFRLAWKDGDQAFDFVPGQFIEVSVLGAGEAPFCIASAPSPSAAGSFECTIKKLGRVTRAIHELNQGDVLGVRGPFGNGFSADSMKGKNVLIVGGGIGLAPLRPLIGYCLDHLLDFKDVTILYGARSVADLVYKYDLQKWRQVPGVRVELTVDPGGQTPDWDGRVGLVPNVLTEMSPSPEGSVLVTCGPPIMIHYALLAAEKLGFEPGQIVTTLERRMQCGFGKCGHCMIGPAYVCKDGPVFTYEQIKELNEPI